MVLHVDPLLAVTIWQRLRRLGGPGLVLLGIADNSVIPLTGSMDVLTIWLAARHHEPWPYYALMATLGRMVRYTIVAGLGALYGNHIVRFFSRYYKPALTILTALACLSAILTLIHYVRYKRRE